MSTTVPAWFKDALHQSIAHFPEAKKVIILRRFIAEVRERMVYAYDNIYAAIDADDLEFVERKTSADGDIFGRCNNFNELMEYAKEKGSIRCHSYLVGLVISGSDEESMI